MQSNAIDCVEGCFIFVPPGTLWYVLTLEHMQATLSYLGLVSSKFSPYQPSSRMREIIVDSCIYFYIVHKENLDLYFGAER